MEQLGPARADVPLPSLTFFAGRKQAGGSGRGDLANTPASICSIRKVELRVDVGLQTGVRLTLSQSGTFWVLFRPPEVQPGSAAPKDSLRAAGGL